MRPRGFDMYTKIFWIHVSDSITLEGHTKGKEAERSDAQNVVKYGETAGITCLTLQPVLALVSINMTFSSLALCSPSSIMICLQERKKIRPDFSIIHWIIPVRTYPCSGSKMASWQRRHHESFSDTYSPLLLQICFVPDEHDDDVTSSLCPDIINPFAGLLEWVHICG